MPSRAELRLQRPLNVPPALTEMELTQHMQQLAASQSSADDARLLPGRRQL